MVVRLVGTSSVAILAQVEIFRLKPRRALALPARPPLRARAMSRGLPAMERECAWAAIAAARAVVAALEALVATLQHARSNQSARWPRWPRGTWEPCQEWYSKSQWKNWQRRQRKRRTELRAKHWQPTGRTKGSGRNNRALAPAGA